MNVRTVDLASIDAGGRLRALDPTWVALLAEEIQKDGQIEAIRVVERGTSFVLIDGALRLAAMAKLGRTGIEARIEPEEALADAAFIRLGEIKGNFLRAELTMLERAYYVAAWRDIYESVNGPTKRGRRPKSGNVFQRNEFPDASNDDARDAFVLSLSEAAQKALQISQATLSRYLRIAAIPPEQGHRLVGHPSADILLAILEWLAISAATIAAAMAVQDGPAWTMPAAGLCAVIGAQLRILAKAAFEDGAITIPADADVVRDISTPVYRLGIPSIPPVRQAGEGGLKRHCDAFVAGVMAYAASRADIVLIAYTPAYGAEAGEALGMEAEIGGRALW